MGEQEANLLDREQHTLGHVNCPVCKREADDLVMRSGQFGTYLFPHAAEKWLAIKRHSISPGMYADYQHWIKNLKRFFGLMPLTEIHIEHVHAYQRSRQVKAGASAINHEIMTLGQIMECAGLWQEIKRFYRPLPLPESCGVALSPDEKEELFRLAKGNRRWYVCYFATLLCSATSAGPGEIRHLQLRDVNMERGVIEVRRALKTKYRHRIIPMNEDAREALSALLDRYYRMCRRYDIEPQPEHYILFHRAHKLGAVPDPHRCMGVWRSAWESMRKKLAKKYPHLANVRRYDIRHTAVTDMVEAGIPDGVIKQIIGHNYTSIVVDRYTHARLEAKQRAVLALERIRPKSESEPRRLEVVGGNR